MCLIVQPIIMGNTLDWFFCLFVIARPIVHRLCQCHGARLVHIVLFGLMYCRNTWHGTSCTAWVDGMMKQW